MKQFLPLIGLGEFLCLDGFPKQDGSLGLGSNCYNI